MLRLTSSGEWTNWLAVCRRFHRYSFHNQVLILSQRPEASWVAGFQTWRQLGRQVRKGERGISILAPRMIRPLPTDQEEPQEEAPLLVGFGVARVFDVAQTDGRDLPSPARALSGGVAGPGMDQLIERALQLGFDVRFTELWGQRNGDCSHALKRIRVRTGLSPNQQLKTLAHELGHALLHGEEFRGDRQQAELEAESVAYVVCSELGVDSSDYSFGYLASWSAGGQGLMETISASGSRISAAASALLDPQGLRAAGQGRLSYGWHSGRTLRGQQHGPDRPDHRQHHYHRKPGGQRGEEDHQGAGDGGTKRQ